MGGSRYNCKDETYLKEKLASSLPITPLLPAQPLPPEAVALLPEPEALLPEPETLPKPEVLLPEPVVLLKEPEVLLSEPEALLPEPEALLPEPEVQLPDPVVLLKEPEAHLAELESQLPKPKTNLPAPVFVRPRPVSMQMMALPKRQTNRARPRLMPADRLFLRHNAGPPNWVVAGPSGLNMAGPSRQNYIRPSRQYIAGPYDQHMAGTSRQKVSQICDHDECDAGPSWMYRDTIGLWCDCATNTPILFTTHRRCRLKASREMLEIARDMLVNLSDLSPTPSSNFYTSYMLVERRNEIFTIFLEKVPDFRVV